MRVSGANLKRNVLVPSSKSYANRALICAALQKGITKIANVPEAQDVLDMLNALEKLGLQIEKRNGEVRVMNCIYDLSAAPSSAIFLGEGGTTIRFILPLLALLPFETRVAFHPRFQSRPLEHLLRTLSFLGANIAQQGECISISGPLKLGEKIEIDCQETTQFASALMLISHEINLDMKLQNVNASQSYLDMSRNVLSHFRKNREFAVSADFSSLTYLAAYAALTEKVVIENVYERDPAQADDKFLDYLNKLGASVEITSSGLTVSSIKESVACVFDVSDCLDAVPALVFVLAYSGKRQKIKNLHNLRFKESDRLTEIQRILDVFQVKHVYDSATDELIIDGRSPDGIQRSVDTVHDHRMVMMSALFLKINGGGVVFPSNAVHKSFPNFFSIFN